ncbi:MAG: hypothetical protein ACE148_09835 [Vicinamibacterales bacterium]
MNQSAWIERFAIALALVLAVSAGGCALALRSPDIAEIRYNPSRYHGKTVSVDGIVTDSWGLPFVPYKMYRVADRTGEMTVLSSGSRTPTRGARVRVRGKVDDLGVVGGRAIGLHIREDALYVR